MATGNAINANSTGIVKYDGSGAFTATTTTNHNLLIGAASNAITNVAPSATSGIPVISQGASADPVFGVAVVAGGGSGLATKTIHSIQVGNGTSPETQLAVGATGTVLTGVTGSDPAFSATPSITSITLSSGTALANYVEGTWTPNIAFGGSSTGVTSSTARGTYTRIGNRVICNYLIVLTSKGAQVGSATMTGLPITVAGNADDYQTARMDAITLTALYTYILMQPGSGGTSVNIVMEGSAQSNAAVTNTMFANTSVVQGTLIYAC